MRPIPKDYSEIAALVGVGDTAHLIGVLRMLYGHTPSALPPLVIPCKLSADHVLVRTLGWEKAGRLVEAFGGLHMTPGVRWATLRARRNRQIHAWRQDGLAIGRIAQKANLTTAAVNTILGRGASGRTAS